MIKRLIEKLKTLRLYFVSDCTTKDEMTELEKFKKSLSKDTIKGIDETVKKYIHDHMGGKYNR